MNEELRNMLAMYLRTQSANAKAMNFAPPEGPGGPSLPQLALKGSDPKKLTASGEYEIPAGEEGEVSVRGSYRRQTSQDPAEWSAGVGYHRKF